MVNQQSTQIKIFEFSYRKNAKAAFFTAIGDYIEKAFRLCYGTVFVFHDKVAWKGGL